MESELKDASTVDLTFSYPTLGSSNSKLDRKFPLAHGRPLDGVLVIARYPLKKKAVNFQTKAMVSFCFNMNVLNPKCILQVIRITEALRYF